MYPEVWCLPSPGLYASPLASAAKGFPPKVFMAELAGSGRSGTPAPLLPRVVAGGRTLLRVYHN